MGGRIPDFLHCEPNSACFLVHALLAAPVGRLTDTRSQGQWPFENADNLTHRDVAWLAAEDVAAAAPLLAVHEAMAFQVQQDRLEEFPRKPLLFSKFRG